MIRSVVIGVAVKMAGAGGTLEDSDPPHAEIKRDQESPRLRFPGSGSRPGRTMLSVPSTATDERLGPGPQGIPLLDALAGQPPHLAVEAQRRAASVRMDVDPLLGRRGQVTSGSRLDHLGLHADRVGHHGQPGRLVLEDLQSALAPAPEVVGQPANPDVPRGQVVRLALLGAREPARPELRSWLGNRSQMTRSRSPGISRPSRSQSGSCCSSPRSVLEEPIQTRSTCSPIVARPGAGPFGDSGPGSTQVGIILTRWAGAPARRAQSARKSLPAITASAVRTVAAKRSSPGASRARDGHRSRGTGPRRRNRRPGAAVPAKQRKLPARQQLSLEDHRIVRGGLASWPDGARPRPQRLAGQTTTRRRSSAGSKARIRYRQQTWSGESTRASSFIPSSVTAGRPFWRMPASRLDKPAGSYSGLPEKPRRIDRDPCSPPCVEDTPAPAFPIALGSQATTFVIVCACDRPVTHGLKDVRQTQVCSNIKPCSIL